MSEERTITPSGLEDLSQFEVSHGSFDKPDGNELPAHDLLRDLLDQGFATLHRDREAAREHLGAEVVVSPLGDVTKLRPDGS